MKNSLDIILPCYNPPKNWVDTVLDNINFIESELPATIIRLIVVNDGSTLNVSSADGVRLKETLPTAQFISYNVNKGKGYAIRKGMEKSFSDYVIFTDIDFPFLNTDLILMATTLFENSADLIVGSRNERYYLKTPIFRKWLSKTLKKVVQFVFHLPCTDTQCGMKGFNALGRTLLLKTTIDRYLFDIELLMMASKDKKIQVAIQVVTLNEGVVFTNIKLVHLFHEGKNLLSLWLKK